jgi:hypothetical protein
MHDAKRIGSEAVSDSVCKCDVQLTVSACEQVIDKVKLELLFNDGGRGTGNAQDMALRERNTLAQDGVVVAAVDVARFISGSRDAAEADPELAMQNGSLRCKVRVTTRGMWTSEGELRRLLHECCVKVVEDMDAASRCVAEAASYLFPYLLL